jgi:hypothetical protein
MPSDLLPCLGYLDIRSCQLQKECTPLWIMLSVCLGARLRRQGAVMPRLLRIVLH